MRFSQESESDEEDKPAGRRTGSLLSRMCGTTKNKKKTTEA